MSQGEPLIYNGQTLLTMPAHSVGTVLATTDYVWYGKITARLKTSRGPGVVTAFILLSDVKDEIDYEFVGTELDIAQTNYYFQGIPSYVNSGNISLSNTYDNFHDYEIEWTPDEIKWSVDGQVGRTKKRSETWNATSNQWAYPQTPSRVQISIWPAGDEKNAKGTIDWAGGPIDWNSDDIKNYGYDFATFGEISVECYNANSGPGTSKGVSYTFNNIAATNDTVVDGNKSTVLKSFLGTGLDMDAGASSATNKPTGTASSSGPIASVPGGSSGGVGSNPGQGADGTGGNNGGSGSNSAPACVATGFSQNACGNDPGKSKNDGSRGVKRTLGASAFAVVIGFAGLLFL
jgi:beta-glucanase (GH16 family)